MARQLVRDQYTEFALRMKKGDKKAATALYEDLVSKVYGFCLNRVSNRDLAEDLTQDIFLKLIDKVELYDEKAGDFLVWFWRMARNTIIDYYRSKKSITASDTDEGFLESIESFENISDNTESRMMYSKVFSYIKTLEPEEQSLFELRYLGELSYTEIAKILKKSEGSLRVAISRLRIKIKNNFRI